MVSHGDSSDYVFCHIVHSSDSGQTTVASMHGFVGSYHGDANSVIIELEVGDAVSVQMLSGGGMLLSSSNSVYSTFSGVLLFQ